MEYIDIVDENGDYTGSNMEKSQAHLSGIWHLAAHIWIYNSNGELLLQKRSINKDTFPGLWDISVAGHISSGESVEQGAIREAQEEIGVSLDPSKLEKIFIHKESNYHPNKNYYNNEFHHVFLYKYDGALSDFKMQEEEVDELRFIGLDQLKTELSQADTSSSFVGHPNYYENIISAVRSRV